MKNVVKRLLPLVDVLLAPIIYPAALLLRNVRKVGVHRLPFCKEALLRVGVFPIRNHYYEPQFDYRAEYVNFNKDRHLPGIDWNVSGQLEFLNRLVFADELEGTPLEKPDSITYYFENDSFRSGDAEYWYQLIRTVKPRNIIEIGSGNSTLMANKAIKRNTLENSNYHCEHVCIEPYEMPWLEQSGVTVVRDRVENMDVAYFSKLRENDILFIDSSHIIRPQGDVVFEYLQLIPMLEKGVIVHVHDIFSPKNYLENWFCDKVKFWNEQYLLEAFLTHNTTWKVIGALNYLHHNHYDKLKFVAPFLSRDREPGSFYIQKAL